MTSILQRSVTTAAKAASVVAFITIFCLQAASAQVPATSHQAGPRWDDDLYLPHEQLFTDAKRVSLYVPTRDRTRLAVDVYRPTRAGKYVSTRLPSIFLYTRYARGSTNADGSFTSTEGITVGKDGIAKLGADVAGRGGQAGAIALFLKYGYAVVVAEMRGSGASFGPPHLEGDDVEARDGKDLIDWITRQSWSDRRVGMFGTSYLAEVQPRVAALRPKGLKALVMIQAFFDSANSAYAMGGIHRSRWAGAWLDTVARLDSRIAAAKAGKAITPVDGDEDRRLLTEAVQQHQQEALGTDYRTYAADFKTVGVLRDRLSFLDSYQAVGANNLSVIVPAFNKAKIATLLIGGWEDLYVTDMMLWNANITVPHKLIYGPWGHGGRLGPGDNPRNSEFQRVKLTEALRWFDYWLKGKSNGAMSEPAIRIEVASDQLHSKHLSAGGWPLPDTKVSRFLFSAGPTGTIASQNDGKLSDTPGEPKVDRWAPDYDTTTGYIGTRWEYKRIVPVNMVANDYRSLTYTSEALKADTLVLGSPAVSIWLASDNAPIVDIYAYLSEVDPDGTSHLVTEGMIRSSHRTLGPPPYNNLGRPFPTSNSQDVAQTAPLTSRPTRITFPLLMTGKIFRAGQRFRVTIAGNDNGNTATPVVTPSPQLRVFLGGETPSHIELPLVALK